MLPRLSCNPFITKKKGTKLGFGNQDNMYRAPPPHDAPASQCNINEVQYITEEKKMRKVNGFDTTLLRINS